ncbi:MAG: tetratricopeptide repeat protein [Candidatus Latescibacterota bacterium]|nr:MAG: tetratricopeptide repeat protein [Candidatus Latescibacterota bacterium]
MIRIIGTVLIVAGLFLAGCKSVETTSSILHNESGRYDLAIETANEALAKNPNDAEAHFQLGIAYSYLDSVGMAYDHFMKSSELDPKRKQDVENNIQSNFAKHYNRALNLLKDDDLLGAAEEFEKASAANPMEAKGYFQLGTTYTQLGNQNPDNPEYYEKAVPNFDKVLELSTPSEKYYIDALSYAGEVLAKAGKPEEAISRFNRLVEEDPTNYRVIEKIGYERLEAQDWKGASVFLDLASKARAKIGAEDFNLFYNLGVANFQMGKGDEAAGVAADPDALAAAIQYYEKGLELEPNEPTTIRNITVAYVVQEDWRQASIWGERFVGVKPDDEDGWRLLARIYNEMGEKDKARQCSARYDELIRAKSSGQ